MGGIGLLGGCSSFAPEPIEPTDKMKGPGLFSGPTGEFKIPVFDSEETQEAKEASDNNSNNDHKKDK